MIINPYKEFYNFEELMKFFMESGKGSALLLYDRILDLSKEESHDWLVEHVVKASRILSRKNLVFDSKIMVENAYIEMKDDLPIAKEYYRVLLMTADF